MSEIRWVVETDEGYGEDIAVAYSDDTPYMVKVIECTKDINKAEQYTDMDKVDTIAHRVKGKVIPILVREVIEVIK